MWQFTLFCVKSLFIFNNLYDGGSVHLRHENKLLFQLVNIAIWRHPQMDPLPKSVEPSWSGVRVLRTGPRRTRTSNQAAMSAALNDSRVPSLAQNPRTSP